MCAVMNICNILYETLSVMVMTTVVLCSKSSMYLCYQNDKELIEGLGIIAGSMETLIS